MHPRFQLIDMCLELDPLLALDGNEVEPTVLEEGIFDSREIIDAVLRRYGSRILALCYEPMREDDISLIGMDLRRELLVDLSRLALRDATQSQAGAHNERSEYDARLHAPGWNKVCTCVSASMPPPFGAFNPNRVTRQSPA